MKMLEPIIALSVFLTFRVQSEAAAPIIYRVIEIQSSAPTINYRQLKSSTRIDFKGTDLLAEAKGSAEVKIKAGATEIDAEFKNLPAATLFGPEFLTYVLWAISPEGRPTNLGELIVKRGKSGLKVTEQLQSFGLVVTAEPYFAVSEPSNVVVMVNAIRKASDAKRESIDAEYKLLQKGQYQVNIIPSELGFVMDKKTPLAVYEARNAVRIARAAGADVFATEGFNRAQQLLTQMETKGVSKKERSAAAREVVQRAEDARSASIKRQETENLAFERQNSKDQISMAHSAATTAELGQARAEVAQAKAEVAEGRADVGRATAEDATVTAEAATATAEADAAAAGRRAEAEKAVLRAQLMQQFNSILQTRDSARGLIVNMSGVLFATEKSELQPEAREKLAKISGIVLAHPDLRLEVEGHTDSLGGDASNQTLSERRAQAARDYLVNQGVSANSVVSRGFGSRQPVDSNDTAAGRQNNRRVEIVVTGESIRISMNTQAPR